MYICAYIPIHAHTYLNMYKYTHTHLHIMLWPGKEGSAYHIDHWLQNFLHRLRPKHCTHLSDPEISIKAWRRSHRDHRWQYRASRSMATRHWIIISLIVQCGWWCWWMIGVKVDMLSQHSRHITKLWRRYYVLMTSFWRKMTSFWRHNDVIITSCVQWEWS